METGKSRSFNDYHLPTEKIWATGFWSLLEKAAGRNEICWTNFTDPRQQQIVRELLSGFPALKAVFFGGYPEAERVRICVFPVSYSQVPMKGKVSCLAIMGQFPPDVLTHRDFLGALLGLGLKREMIGDIIYQGEGKAYVFLVPALVSFVEQNLKNVGRYPVQVEEKDAEGLALELVPRRVKEIKGTVASMRLDAIAGLGFGLSRSKVVPLIKRGQVKVNHQVICQPSYQVKTGDLVSLAGKGRVEVTRSTGETRRGRIHLYLLRIF